MLPLSQQESRGHAPGEEQATRARRAQYRSLQQLARPRQRSSPPRWQLGGYRARPLGARDAEPRLLGPPFGSPSARLPGAPPFGAPPPQRPSPRRPASPPPRPKTWRPVCLSAGAPPPSPRPSGPRPARPGARQRVGTGREVRRREGGDWTRGSRQGGIDKGRARARPYARLGRRRRGRGGRSPEGFASWSLEEGEYGPAGLFLKVTGVCGSWGLGRRP